ncbi:MAG: FKBP-type peptidyl-prolyl cis-trans isomerase, partial [Chloroflexota bacterium]
MARFSIAFCVVLLLGLTACGPTGTTPAATPAPMGAGGVAPSGTPLQLQQVKTVSGLVYEDVVIGAGASPKVGDTVTVHYTGRLTNGTKFDSS